MSWLQQFNSKVPYAQIHNEGGIIARNARSEIFVRNRYKIGAKGKAFGGQGLYKKGIKTGDGKKTLQGLTFKAYTIKIPQRQFMGHSAILNKRIIKRLKESF
ncbi:MAG: hypothetical protein EOO61_08515 [Hymenobacter sp.]|nr:MAG: hypothetical protein EOO61_08515 [Hymenobacter sp.]